MVVSAHEKVEKRLIAVGSVPIHELGIELNAIGLIPKKEKGRVLFDSPLLPYIAYEICTQHRKTRELFPVVAPVVVNQWEVQYSLKIAQYRRKMSF
jgi:hypothetical protein